MSKITVYTLAWDDDGGTGCQVFPTKEALQARQVSIMVPDEHFESYPDPERMRHISGLINEGAVDEAWAYWLDHLAKPLDTYNADEQTIELPALDEVVQALHTISTDVCTCADRGWYDPGHDTMCPVTIIGDILAKYPQPTTPTT